MLDEVKKEMERNEEKVFNVLIKIMKDKGGPPCTLAKHLEGQFLITNESALIESAILCLLFSVA